MTQAATALLGTERTNILREMYEAINAAEQRGYAQGQSDVTFDNEADAYSRGYKEGYVDGNNDASEVAERAFTNGFEEGYEHARIDLGECPIIEDAFDDELFEDLFIFPTDGEARD
jgi:flagellar biosynthesis/type III secretory pathway protein FliH